eukprot:3668088-Amphidinium_carterae.1
MSRIACSTRATHRGIQAREAQSVWVFHMSGLVPLDRREALVRDKRSWQEARNVPNRFRSNPALDGV